MAEAARRTSRDSAAGRCRRGAKSAIGGQVNPVIQLAAALDRRGVMVSIDDGYRLLVHLGGYREHIVIARQVRGVALCDIGKTWLWEHGGKSGTHPASDHEGAAAAIEAFPRADPGLVGTALLRRMDKYGQPPGPHEDKPPQAPNN